MADIQCKMCGGELALPENAVSGTCQYCDSRCGTTPAAAGNSNPLLKRAQLFLEQGDFESAKEYCENVLDSEPENGWAYFIRMMAELKVTDEKQLVDIDFSGNKTFQLVTRFADAELKSKMDGILKAKRKIEEEEARKKALRSRRIFFSVTGVVLVVIIRISISSYRYSMQLKNGDICRIEDNVVTDVVYNRYKIKKAVIPPGVTSIGGFAFIDCKNLTSVEIPDSVTTIGALAFSGCSGLTSVTIPDSVTAIGEHAFDGCSGLTSVTIGNSVTTIGVSAFYRCKNLRSVTIGNSVTTIGEYAFEECENLRSVEIPDSVTTIGDNAFERCKNLRSVEIPDSVTTIGKYAFYDCENLTSVTIPANATVGSSAFPYNCKVIRRK